MEGVQLRDSLNRKEHSARIKERTNREVGIQKAVSTHFLRSEDQRETATARLSGASTSVNRLICRLH